MSNEADLEKCQSARDHALADHAKVTQSLAVVMQELAETRSQLAALRSSNSEAVKELRENKAHVEGLLRRVHAIDCQCGRPIAHAEELLDARPTPEAAPCDRCQGERPGRRLASGPP